MGTHFHSLFLIRLNTKRRLKLFFANENQFHQRFTHEMQCFRFTIFYFKKKKNSNFSKLKLHFLSSISLLFQSHFSYKFRSEMCRGFARAGFCRYGKKVRRIKIMKFNRKKKKKKKI